MYVHHINFPGREELSEIAMVHYPSLSNTMRDHALSVLYELRQSGLEKPPATGELLEWLGAMSLMNVQPPATIHGGNIPYMGVLLKRGTDLEKFSNGRIGRRGRSERV